MLQVRFRVHHGQTIATPNPSLAAKPGEFDFPLAGSSRSQGTGTAGPLAAAVERVQLARRDVLALTSGRTGEMIP
jgi:hypothetical protein